MAEAVSRSPSRATSILRDNKNDPCRGGVNWRFLLLPRIKRTRWKEAEIAVSSRFKEKPRALTFVVASPFSNANKRDLITSSAASLTSVLVVLVTLLLQAPLAAEAVRNEFSKYPDSSAIFQTSKACIKLGPAKNLWL